MKISLIPWKKAGTFCLVLKEADWKALHAHLLCKDGLERAALGLLGHARRGKVRELYLHRLVLPSDQLYVSQSPAFVELHPKYALDGLSHYVQSDATGYLYAHSHPFCDRAEFSSIDDRFHPRLAQGLGRLMTSNGARDEVQEALFVRLVCGRAETGFAADVFDGEGRCLGPIRTIRLIGRAGLKALRRTHPLMSSPLLRWPLRKERPPKLSERWARNVAWMGAEGQRKLAQTSLAIVGAGGLGSLALHMALGLGFRRLCLIDHDRVEHSNLNRLMGLGLEDVGKTKVEALATKAAQCFPQAQVEVVPHRVEDPQAQSALGCADLLVVGVDDDEARLTVQNFAVRHLKPLLDMGSGFRLDPQGKVQHMGGQVRWYVPGGPCLVCQGLDPLRVVPRTTQEAQKAAGYVSGAALTPASAITVNAAVASVGLDLVVRFLTGYATNPTYIQLDLLGHGIRKFDLSKKPDCPLCGPEGIEGLGTGRARLRPCPRKVERFPLFARS